MAHTDSGLSGRIEAEIRAEMARQQIRQAALALKIGVNQQWVSRRLTGDVPPTVDDLERFAEALDLTVVDLIARAYGEDGGRRRTTDYRRAQPIAA